MDLVEKDPYILSLELPEIHEDEVQIEVREDRVTIRAMKRGREPLRVWPFRRRFALERSFRLPADADVERLEASFDDGTLTLRVHRTLGARGPGAVIEAFR